MRPAAFAVLAAALVALALPLAPPLPPAAGAADSTSAPALEGRYAVDDVESRAVIVSRMAPGFYSLNAPGLWHGAAFVEAGEFWGSFYYAEGSVDRSLADCGGFLRGTIDPHSTWEVHGEFIHGRGGKFAEKWMFKKAAPPAASRADGTPAGDSVPPGARVVIRDGSSGGPPPKSAAPPDSGLPGPGDYVYVEELPTAITKAVPVYPEEARRAGVSGTVMVKALVARDGRVVDAKVASSIPELDDAAIQSVRQWEFKPAMNKGQPIAVWVMIPIKFTLH